MIEILFWGIIIFIVLGLAVFALGFIISYWKEMIATVFVIVVLGVIGKVLFGG